MKRHLLTAAIALAATLVGRAQESREIVQIVEAPLYALGGDWELGNLGESPDLTATGQGKVLTYAWMDETGLADVEIQLEIHWRHHRGVPCSAYINGVFIGQLDQPQETFLVQPNVFYPTIHFLRIPAGAYSALGLNEFALMTNDAREGASVGVCEPPGMEVALRFTIGAARAEEVKPPENTNPVIPQAMVLVDISTGITIQPGMIVVSVNIQIQAVLADANGGSVSLQIEIQVAGGNFTGVPTSTSEPVANGETATVPVPAYEEGEREVRARTVDSEGSASEWVPVDMVLAASGDSTIVRAVPLSSAPKGNGFVAMPAGDDSSSASCSAGAASGSGALLIGLAALILIGAFRGRIR